MKFSQKLLKGNHKLSGKVILVDKLSQKVLAPAAYRFDTPSPLEGLAAARSPLEKYVHKH